MVLLHNNQNKTDMKKLIPILFVVAVLAACQKEPSLSKLDDDYVVFTDYDKSADFGEYLTYYMPDSVLLITNNEKATYWTNEDADYGCSGIHIGRFERRCRFRVTGKLY